MREQAFRSAAVAATCLAAIVLLNGGSLATTLRIGGTGSGLAAAQAVGDDLAAIDPGFRIEVLPSLGTAGGLQAMMERAIGLALAARRLTPEERARGMTEAACVNTALVLASSLNAPAALGRADLPRLYAEIRPTWPDGSPMKIVLPSRAGTEVAHLSAAVPGLGPAFEKAYKQPWTPVGTTDQENVELAQKIPGSLAIATLLQIRAERLNLRALTLDGVAPKAATIAERAYPFIVRLCLVLPAAPQPEAIKFVEHFRSPAGHALLRSFDAEPGD